MTAPAFALGDAAFGERFEWLEPVSFEASERPAPGAPAAAPPVDFFARSLELAAPQAAPETGEAHVRWRYAPPPGAPEPFALYRARLAYEKARLSGGFDRLVALDALGFAPFAHQIDAVRRALAVLRGRAILADEVGLGKTIEAGLALKELSLRELARRMLVLVPASLVAQWRAELAEKFGEDFHVVREPADWEAGHDRLIASLDLAKGDRHAALATAWAPEVVVVDEAHKIKRASTRAHRFVAGLSPRYMLLLTATPIQNDLEEIYHLVHLLSPGELGTKRSFLLRHADAAEPRVAREADALRDALRRVMIRHRRADVGLSLPPRRAGIYRLKLPPLERALYDGVSAYLEGALSEHAAPRHARLTLPLLQRALCSSPAAAAGVLEAIARSPETRAGARERLLGYAAEARALGAGRKVSGAVELIRAVAPDEPVVCFTEFRATQRALLGGLRDAGLRAHRFDGSMTLAAKEEAIARFAAEGGVLVSTDAGAEGRNLQFARTLLNFDLPWNPMRVEQRIGRVHRLGQTREVRILNLGVEDTVEAHVLDLLATKIRLFEVVVGELDAILGEATGAQPLEAVIEQAWRKHPTAAGFGAALAGLGDRLDAARDRYLAQRRANDLLGSPA